MHGIHFCAAFKGTTQCTPWPRFAIGDKNGTFAGYNEPSSGCSRQTDNSFLGAITSGDFFMGVQPEGKHYIAFAEPTGFVGWHGHSSAINGSKFFSWGQNGAGRFMQDFLGGISGPGPIAENARVGDYAELQVGPAFTQMQTWDLPAGKPVQWTEYFGAFVGDRAALMGSSYEGALAHVDEWRASSASGVNDSVIADVDAFLVSIADRPPTEILSRGMPWGAIELERRRVSGASTDALFPPGTSFSASPDDDEARPWLELISSAGTFSAATLAKEPTSYQVSPEWLALLNVSATQHGVTWLHDLHIAVILTEQGLIQEPIELFSRSLDARPSAIAARNLAVLQSTPELAWPLFQRAWAIAAASADLSRTRLLTNLATEISLFLMGQAKSRAAKTYLAALSDFIAALPATGIDSLSTLDAVLVAKVELSLQLNGDFDKAIAILSDPTELGCFPTYASERKQLMDLWNAAQLARAEAGKGRPLSAFERRNLRVAIPAPRNIGCPYGGGPGYPDCYYW